MTTLPPPNQPTGGQPPYGQQTGYGQAYGQQPYGGQPGYATPTPPRQGKRGGKGGKITFFIGLPLFLIGLVLAIIGFSGLMGMATDMVGAMNNSKFTEATKYESTGEGLMVMVMSENGGGSCTVKDPGGNPVALQTNTSTSASGKGQSVGGFTADKKGAYQITCNGGTFYLFPVELQRIIAPTIMMAIGIPLGIIGFIVSLIGLILWLNGRNKTVY